MIVVIVGGPRPLLRALWGRLSNKSRLLCWGPVHRCHQQVPCNEGGRGRGVWCGEGSSLINFRSRNEQMDPDPWDGERQPSSHGSGDTRDSKWIDCQVPAAV